MRIVMVMAAVSALALAACGGGTCECKEPGQLGGATAAPASAAKVVEPAEEVKPAPAPEPAPAETTSVARGPVEDTPADAPTSPDDPRLTVGVPECDEYIRKMMVCLQNEQIPEATRNAATEGFLQAVEQWKALPEGAKAQLGNACKSAMDAQREAFRQLGCEF